MRTITKPCYVKVWTFSRWHVSMPSRNVGGVIALTPHVSPVYRRDAHWQITGIILRKRMYRKRRMACSNVIDARVFGTWLPIVDICRVASAAESRTASNSARGHAIIQYAVTVPGLIMPDIDSVQLDCNCPTRLP